ncbi:protein amalgam-like isoform X2 [Eriocheir sinensis]|uniref:protein amalgam-like isoform X2 n=1 Tax=Eriocheir sinensis TaxID=95602 RepID=UPI0021C6CC7F|nr:protein amalgam-like isoform X2 [Eriocheir sinensis]
MLLMMLMILLGCLGHVLGAGPSGGSPWSTGDNDYYYDSLNPAHSLPVITTRSQHLLANQGEDVLLPCTVKNLGEYSLVWRRGGQILWLLQEKPEGALEQAVTRDDRFSLNGTNLTLQDAGAGDGGIYTCELSTQPLITVNHTLSMRVPPTVYPGKNRTMVTVKMGSSVNLACHAQGSPEPTVTWSVKGRNLTRRTSGNELLVTKAQPEDNGVYTCTATNGAATNASTTITLQVMYPPKVQVENEEVFTGVTYPATLACFVEAEPRARVSWYRTGDIPVDPMRLAKSVTANGMYTLHFNVVTLEDFGVYTCNATNYMGNASAVLSLTGRPRPVRYFSPPHGDDNTTYTLIWDVESYAPVLAYSINYGNASDPVDQWVNFTVPGTSSSSTLHSSSHTFENLQPAAAYHVQVTATNEFGESDVNETFRFSTLTPGLPRKGVQLPPPRPSPPPSLLPPAVVSETDEEVEVAPPEATPTLCIDPTPGEGPAPQQELSSSSPVVISDGGAAAESSASAQDSSGAPPTLTPFERRTQMGAFLTAIILSCFF